MEGEKSGIYFSPEDLHNMIAVQMSIKSAIELNIFDTLIESGPKARLTTTEIASKIPTKNPNVTTSLDRILRVLSAYGILSMSLSDEDSLSTLYTLNKAYRCLSKNGNEEVVSTAANVLVQTQNTMFESLNILKDAVLEDGCVPFDKAFGTSGYDYMSRDPNLTKLFEEAMTATTKLLINDVFSVYEGFGNVKELVDVGGGNGVLLGSILSVYPHIHGINFDLPHVISAAPKIPGIKYVSGDMFESLPKTDAILLKYILHNWNDEDCKKVLVNCWKALPKHGKAIIIEHVIPSIVKNDIASRCATLFDIKMMALFKSKERTIAEFKELAKDAGFVEIKVFPISKGIHILEFSK